jgi:hypothetical protein
MNTLMKRHLGMGLVVLATVAVVALLVSSLPVAADSPQAASQLTQLTTGGCCPGPFWSGDSQQVLYIDKPDATAPVGIYGVDIAHPQMPQLVTPRIAYYAQGMSLLIELEPGSTTIERVSDEERWTVPAGGAPVTISPNQVRVAWQDGNTGSPFGAGATRIMVADFDGTGEQTVATVNRGSISGWLSDDVLLLTARTTPGTLERVLYSLSVPSGELTELARAENLRGQTTSPDGAWIAYYVAPNPDPSENGLWFMRSDGSEQLQVPPELFGAYQWRDEYRLLIVPFRPTAESHELWEFDVTTQQTRRLTDPELTPFKINDGDWAVSPDGRKVVFVSAQDRNLRLLSLPE